MSVSTERVGLWVVTVSLIAYLLVFVPSPSPEQSLYLPKVLFLGGAVLLAALAYAERLGTAVRGWLPALLLGHLALVSLSDLLLHDSGGWTYPFFGATGRSDGWLSTLVVVGLCLVVVTMIEVHGSRTVLRHLAGATLAAGVGQSLVMVVQAAGVDPARLMYLQHRYLNPDGTTANSGFTAAVLLAALLAGSALLTMPSAGRLQRLVRPALILVAVALGLSGNRTTVIALVVVLLPVLSIRAPGLRRWFVAALAVTILTAVATEVMIPKSMAGTSQALQGRVRIWRLAGDVIRVSPHQPWIGLGPEAMRLAVLRGLLPPERLIPLHEHDPAWPQDATLLGVRRIRAAGAPLRSTLFQFRFRRASGAPFFYQLPMQYDKAHDLWLDETVSNGILDGVLWIVLFAGGVLLAWRRRDPTSRVLAVTVLALGVFYVAWFPALFFWPYHLVLLVLAWRYRAPPHAPPAEQGASPLPAAGQGA